MKLFTDRQSILIREANELNRGDYLCVYLRQHGASQVTSDDIARLLKEGQLSLVYQNVDFRVYRISKSRDLVHGGEPLRTRTTNVGLNP